MQIQKTPADRIRSWLSCRYGGVLIFLLVYLCLSFATRVALLCQARADVAWDISLLAAAGWGLLFDLATGAWISLPLIVVLTLLPAGFFKKHWARVIAGIICCAVLLVLLFGAAAEWFFWDEFSTRFNFIAVDYLIYTNEVLGNIRESYPMPAILGGLLAVAVLLFWLIWRTGLPRIWLDSEHEPFRCRLRNGALWLTAALLLGTAVRLDWLPSFANNFNRELAQNGTWSLFAAFFENELDYERFYASLPKQTALSVLQKELTEDGSVLLKPKEFDTLRFVRNEGQEQHPNIIQITVESLSAEYIGAWNPQSDLTPNLDALAQKSLIFTQLYATGTRTVRGMESLALSLPPTPGSSVVRRPHNEKLFSLGSVLRAKGYDTAFIYGGFGYFDNMNSFFSENGYRVVDRSSVKANQITFANIWGACDQNLYSWTLAEADKAAAADKPFHFFLMTTSNHRPFTFPDGQIDLPSQVSGRKGGVKYTDHAIGEFIRNASTKPWFKNTVFVIVADHCASSAGKTELPVDKYHIPLLIYAPGGQVAPGKVSTLMSQMDYAPTLLGLLNWTYPSRFFGHDIRKIKPSAAHALLGNYQKVGYIEDGKMTVLAPKQVKTFYDVAADSTLRQRSSLPKENEEEAISYYQMADYLFDQHTYSELEAEEFAKWMQTGEMAFEKRTVTPVP
ncbi:sulfatase-like hydrolase/transferase [Desulfobulbus sp. F5]|nr:sulfatase-like hydrolase/transferase [Desulfobulbus sp. F5]